MRGELMTPLIPVDGWLEASDVDGFLNSELVPIAVAGRENCEVRRPKMVVIVSSMRHRRGLKIMPPLQQSNFHSNFFLSF